jgi:ribosomal protein S18 acetylase RimI-like enzyme
MPLIYPTEQHFLQVKNWFSNHQEIYTWGGPNMTLPMSDQDFLRLLTADHYSSFCLLNNEQQLLAFGQTYRRLEHHHLGRLAVNPKYRGQGYSKILITEILEQVYLKQSAEGASLFVFKNNIVAYDCYQSLGFIKKNYPEETLPGNLQNCIYMTLPRAF